MDHASIYIYIYVSVRISSMSYFSLEEILYSSPSKKIVYSSHGSKNVGVYFVKSRKEQKGYPLRSDLSLSLCFVVFQARRSIDQIRIEKHLPRTFRVSKHMQMDRWKAVTSGYRLAFESPETWYVATLNNAQAYFSIAYTRCRCRSCKRAIVTVPIYFRPFIVNNIPRILQKSRYKNYLENNIFFILRTTEISKIPRKFSTGHKISDASV